MRLIPTLLLSLFLFMPIFDGPKTLPDRAPIISGTFSQYGQRPTDATIEYRDSVGQLPKGVHGYIATESCDHVGDRAWISLNNGPWFRVGVFDCSGHSSTSEWMQKNRIIGELDFYLATEYDTIGSGIDGRLMLDE